MARSPLAEVRAQRALTGAGLAPEQLAPVDSVTNEVWASAEHVVRVNPNISGRLRREYQVVRALPPELGYPEVVAHGREQSSDWIVARRRPGLPLVRWWGGLDATERRDTVRQFAGLLQVLHATPFPDGIPDLDDLPQLLRPGPRAVEPLLAGLDALARLPHVDSGALRELAAWVGWSARLLGDFTSPTFIHGDLHFQNVLWDRGRITALLDFEYARAAPGDLDLDVLLRFFAHPHLFVPPGREAEAQAGDYERAPWWLAEDYPELFARPHAVERLRLYAVAFDVRQALADPPHRPPAELTRDHPYQRLLRTLRGRSYLDAF
jgi:aminoglycoside phosphotransferase (APT) family kinase protein